MCSEDYAVSSVKAVVSGEPKTGRAADRSFMHGCPWIDMDYCQFSDWGYMKPTGIWGAFEVLPVMSHAMCILAVSQIKGLRGRDYPWVLKTSTWKHGMSIRCQTDWFTIARSFTRGDRNACSSRCSGETSCGNG